MLDKDELIPYKDQGCNLTMHRLSFICEGPWYIVDWNGSINSPIAGAGFAITAEYDPDPDNFIWEHASIINQKSNTDNTPGSVPPGWMKNPVTPQAMLNTYSSGFLQKTMKCSIKKWISNITAIESPTCQIPLFLTDIFVTARNNNEYFLDIYPPIENGNNRRFRLSAESLTPYSKKGGKMIEWKQEYTYQTKQVYYETVL